eukprot:8070375-Pyramimonas_sp.AAC.1
MAEGPPRKQRKRTLEATDGLVEAITSFLKNPESFEYDLEMEDPVDSAKLKKAAPLILAVRKAIYPNAAISSVAAAGAFQKVASENEKTWHLADQIDDWAQKKALRHVQQNIIKNR